MPRNTPKSAHSSSCACASSHLLCSHTEVQKPVLRVYGQLYGAVSSEAEQGRNETEKGSLKKLKKKPRNRSAFPGNRHCFIRRFYGQAWQPIKTFLGTAGEIAAPAELAPRRRAPHRPGTARGSRGPGRCAERRGAVGRGRPRLA